MQEASLVGLVRTILIILFIYFGLKLIFKWFGPLILKYFMRKMGEKAFKGFNQQDFSSPNSSHNNKKNIDKDPETKRKEKKPVGEYIDYEEID